jgi:N-acetyl-gamma-glutamyl-phosphate reductase
MNLKMSLDGPKKTVAVLGASGYTGAELMRILSNHPGVKVEVLTADRSAGSDFRTIYPQFAYQKDLPILSKWEDSVKTIEKCDVAFCCLPHGTTQEIIGQLAASSKTVKVGSLHLCSRTQI